LLELEPCAAIGREKAETAESESQPQPTRDKPASDSRARRSAADGPRARSSRVSRARSRDSRAARKSAGIFSKPGALIGLGSGAALLSIGGYFGWRAHDAANDVSGFYGEGRTWTNAAAEREAQGQRDEHVAVAAASAGLVALGIGAWLLITD
jgi:hypothetical protein